MDTWKAASLLVFLFALPNAVELETPPEVESLLKENLRTSSRSSEDIQATLLKVENLVQTAGNTSVTTDKVLAAVETTLTGTINVSNSLAAIQGRLDVLDNIAAASDAQNASLKSVQEGVKKVTSSVGNLAESLSRCKSEAVESFKEVSSSLFQELSGTVKQHCVVAGSRAETEQVTRRHIAKIMEDVDSVARRLAEFQNDTAKKLEAIQEAVARKQDEYIAKVQSINATMRLLMSAVERTKKKERFVWNVDGVDKAIKYCESSSKEALKTSPIFVISGYSAKLRLRVVKVNGTTWLESYLVLCPGSQDDFVQWPFLRPFTLSLLHPSDASFNVVRKFPPAAIKGRYLKIVKRPKGKCHNGFLGFRKLGDVNALRRQGFEFEKGLAVEVELYARP